MVMDAAAVRRHYLRTYLVLDVVRGLAGVWVNRWWHYLRTYLVLDVVHVG